MAMTTADEVAALAASARRTQVRTCALPIPLRMDESFDIPVYTGGGCVFLYVGLVNPGIKLPFLTIIEMLLTWTYCTMHILVCMNRC